MNLKSLSWIVCTATLLVAVEANAQRTPRRRAGAPAPATTQPEVPVTPVTPSQDTTPTQPINIYANMTFE